MSQPPDGFHPKLWVIKRGLDVTVAAAGLLALGPVLGALALAICIDSPGPPLFVQERVGRHGVVFPLYKLRTMVSGASIRFNADGSTRIDAGDARVTRLGKYLRGAPDELPQLLNVMMGHMSLVGPRPDMPVHAALYTETERAKLRVPPGITSLAAVLGRNDLPWKQRIAIDLCYIEHWSLGLDARIALQTLLMPLGVQLFDFTDVVPPELHPRATPVRRATAASVGELDGARCP